VRPDPSSPNRPFVGVSVGIGAGLGAMVGAATGNWQWLPVVLCICIGLGGLATAITQRW
jgi:hypothetical protein